MTDEERYTPYQVRMALQRYPELKSALDVQTNPYGGDEQQFDTRARASRRPLGWTAQGPSWPFMAKPHASPPFDGKKKAVRLQDLSVLVLDLEGALNTLPADQAQFLVDYYILDDPPEERRDRLHHDRAYYPVRKLTRTMNTWCGAHANL